MSIAQLLNDFTVMARKPTDLERPDHSPANREAIEQTDAELMQHLAKALLTPGVQLDVAPDIPLFSADPDHPGRLIRKLNGEITRGVFEDGAFKVLDE